LDAPPRPPRLQESFEGAKIWVRELKLYGQPNVVIALAANKCDLEQYRLVSMQEGQAYARENDMTYYETSAKTAHNVRRLFTALGARPPPLPPPARPHFCPAQAARPVAPSRPAPRARAAVPGPDLAGPDSLVSG
jgi:hypothetical protein